MISVLCEWEPGFVLRVYSISEAWVPNKRDSAVCQASGLDICHHNTTTCGPQENLSRLRDRALLVSVTRSYKLCRYIVYSSVPPRENVSVVGSQGGESRSLWLSVSEFSVVRSRNLVSSSIISIYLRSELTLIDTKPYRSGVLWLTYSVLPAGRLHLAA
jgi:hypothetical protein